MQTPPETPLVVLGLVQFSKRLGVDGNWLMVEALLLGAAFGFAQQFAPTALSAISTAMLYGLAACGIFDLIKPVLQKT